MQWYQYQIFSSDHVRVPLPEGHRFPMGKYELLRLALLEQQIFLPSQIIPSTPVSEEDLKRVHSEAYIENVRENHSPKDLRPIGLTWSPLLVLRSMTSVGGFVQAAEAALRDGFSALLAGGTHHAHSDRGEGYCVFNDFAVAALKLLEEKKVSRILIIDLDVHQGNGNSSILGDREDVFILSLHGERNYPFRKVPSHLDVPLPAGIGDDDYISALEEALKQIENITFDMIFYQAGVDVLKEDSLGTFSLTLEGLRRRDALVFGLAKRKQKPLVLAIGGGYSKPIDYSVAGYVEVFKTARHYF
jgi:acetoin utilization deacetylase AcuC-like enzyme